MAQQPLVFVLDECLSFRLARMLAGCHERHPHFRFVAMRDLTKEGTEDAEWLATLPDQPPHVVITRDAVLRDSAQHRAWLQGGLTLIILDGAYGNVQLYSLAAMMFRWLPAILRTAKAYPTGRAFSVPARFEELEILPWHAPSRRRPRKPRQTAHTHTQRPKSPRAGNQPSGQSELNFSLPRQVFLEPPLSSPSGTLKPAQPEADPSELPSPAPARKGPPIFP